ncbi:glycosyltransferase [Rubrobacter xylanophilus]|uniref:glycosyltransferase n=1 Tax=Rubrobacter xylanophilus TaxID=49319 RepID=UPI0000550BFE|nr:glycosyltransferase [Rubrobacter xylanophilus]
MRSLTEIRVALVLEWFQLVGGSERVVGAIREIFPAADIFAIVHNERDLKGTSLEGVHVRTSFIQSLPQAKEKYRLYLPLMPLAVEQFDLRPYDLVISSSHTVAKGVLTRADQLHVSYVHTPVRYAWDLYLDYLKASKLDRGLKTLLVRPILHYLRLWDTVASNRVDAFFANSESVSRRISKLYRRTARVIYPPVEVDRYRYDRSREDFYVTVSRFVPYKRIDLIAEAFTRMGRKLVVIGDGPDRAKIEKLSGPNVELLGYQPDDVVSDYLERARAFIFAADEDFGIAPVEAQAAGCPVIAYGRGGALETILGWPVPKATGVFFDSQTPESLEKAVRLFEAYEEKFDPKTCRLNAERFDKKRFSEEFETAIEELWNRFQCGEDLE